MFGRLIEIVFNGRMSMETRVRGVVVALIVLSALSANVSELKTAWERERESTEDEVSRYEKRLAPLKNMLPQRGVVGYVTDARTPIEEGRRSYMTGYALAPLLVEPGTHWPLVIGDFADPAAARRTVDGFRVRQDFGEGLVLFAAEEK